MRIKWNLCLIGTAILAALFLCQMKYGKNDHDMQNPDLLETSHEDAGDQPVPDENEEDIIYFSLLDGKILQIDRDRFHDAYGVRRLDNRWELDEIDKILNSVRGKWKAEEYMGFILPSLYFPDLWDNSDDLSDDIRNSLYDMYEEKTKHAAANIPEISLSIKEEPDGTTVEQNYIYSKSRYSYESPISIILSLERMDENYPVFADAAALSTDFTAEYPVMYIKFFLRTEEDEYEPAALVITSDKRFYILIDGAFYSLAHSE